MHDDLYQALAEWIDTELAGSLPPGIAAFHFNLYDGGGFDLELIGAPLYLPDDDDWACDDIFMSAPPRFELPEATVGDDWEAALDVVAAGLRAYLASTRSGAARLKQSQAVSVGFVDGDLQLLWRP